MVGLLCIDCPEMHAWKEEQRWKEMHIREITVIAVVCKGVTEKSLDRRKLTEPELEAIEDALDSLYDYTDSNLQAVLVGITGDKGKWRFVEDEVRHLACRCRVFLSVTALLPMVNAAFKNFEKVLCLTEAREEEFLEACYETVIKDRLTVKSVKDLPGYKDATCQSQTQGSDAFAQNTLAMVMQTIKDEQDAGVKGEGIKAIVTSGIFLTTLTPALRKRTRMPVFDQVSLIRLFLMGLQMSSFNDPDNKGKKDNNRKIGILRLDYHYPPAKGDAAHPDSYTYEVHFRHVDGLHFEVAQAGIINEEITVNFTKAIRELESMPVCGISGDCGFMMHYQCLVRFLASSTPVFMSSLILAGTLALALRPYERVLILTANEETFKPGKDKLLLDSGITVSRSDQMMIHGLQNLDGFEAVANAEKVDVPLVTRNIRRRLRHLLDRYKHHRPIAFIILECTELPPYADAIREETGLPVFDCISIIDYFRAATDKENWNLSGFPPHNPAFWNDVLNSNGTLKAKGKQLFGDSAVLDCDAGSCPSDSTSVGRVHSLDLRDNMSREPLSRVHSAGA